MQTSPHYPDKATLPTPVRSRYCERKTTIAYLVLTATLAGQAHGQAPEQPDAVTFSAGLGHTWDSNYNRNPAEEDEQITTGRLGVRLLTDISRQRFTASANVARYDHKERGFLDTTTAGGGVAWSGAIGNSLKPHLSWSRREDLIDRAEFEGKDVLTRDETKGGLVISPGQHWQFPVTLRRVEQDHSNSSQEALDYIDEEIEAGARYVSARRSSVGINMIAGQREYPNQNRDRPSGIPDQGDLDFDYSRLTLESRWVVSPKTQLEGSLGYFNRDGEANDGSGGLASLDAHWKPTGKVDLSTGVQYAEPAIGESTDSPSEIMRWSIDLEWQATSKVMFGTGYAWIQQDFDANAAREAREETTHRFNPLTARYEYNESLAFVLRTVWIERSSPREDRDYDAAIATLGISLKL